MSERIEKIVYNNSSVPEGQESPLWITGPAEFLCAELARQLLADEVWKGIFGENIDPYKRMDYAIRNLPALRVYNNGYVKEFESWFVTGDLVLDVIYPANIRRPETQQFPDTITSALMQQFRRPKFFNAMCARVPGLNELGKRFDVDKSLAFEWGEQDVPLTQINLNFRLDLRQWDLYLEQDDRTKDDPFSRPLGDLKRIVTKIVALRDENIADVELSLDIDQTI